MKRLFAVLLTILMLFTLFPGALRENVVKADEVYKAETLIEKEESQKVIILQVGKTSFTVNGVTNTLDSPPVIKNSRTLLPIRAIIEALGGRVDWDATTKKVTVSLESNIIELIIGKSTALVNNTSKPIDSANSKVVPEIINNRTMLPLRFVAENLGCSVSFESSTQTITLKYPEEVQQITANMKIVNIHFKGTTDDNKNPNNEWVEIKNNGATSANLKGYVLEDFAKHRFVFPDFVLDAGKTVKVYSGSGTQNSSSLYWGSSSAIWNNDGDTAYLYDNNGKLIDTYKYP